MKWFKHDSDANMDARLQEVLLDYGLEGYGLYWYCIELITQKVDSENITFELEHDARIIARNTGSSPQKVQEMMTRFVEIGLFENCDGVITCLKLAKRLDKSMTNSPAMREFIDNVRERHDIVRKCQPRIDKKKNRIEEDKNNNNDIKDVLNHLNMVTGRRFETDKEIKARLKTYTVDDLKSVIDYKAREWMGTDMQKYLRPQTLFNKTKFEGYWNDSQQMVPTNQTGVSNQQSSIDLLKGMSFDKNQQRIGGGNG